MWSRIPAAVVVGWRITSQNERLEPGVGDSTLPLCLSFPIRGKRRVNLVYTELQRAGQQQNPFGFPLKLPSWDFFPCPTYWGTVTLENHCWFVSQMQKPEESPRLAHTELC